MSQGARVAPISIGRRMHTVLLEALVTPTGRGCGVHAVLLTAPVTPFALRREIPSGSPVVLVAPMVLR